MTLLHFYVGTVLEDLMIVIKCMTDISAEEVSKYALNFSTSSSCVIKIVEHRARATLDDLKAAVLKVNTSEVEGNIPPWDDEHVPEEIVSCKPDPGYVCLRLSYLSTGLTSIIVNFKDGILHCIEFLCLR